jgi:hypothetical protein
LGWGRIRRRRDEADHELHWQWRDSQSGEARQGPGCYFSE